MSLRFLRTTRIVEEILEYAKSVLIWEFSRCMAGIMGVTAFLSMWISNSAATSIMLPVVLAITDELERYEKELHDKTRANKEASSAINGNDTVLIE